MGRKKAAAKGSITVFCCLILTGLLSFTGVILEAVQMEGMKCQAANGLDMGLYSVFAEYHPELLNLYDVFFLDSGYGGSCSVENVKVRFQNYVQYNSDIQKGTVIKKQSLFPVKLEECSIAEWELATDYQGLAFKNQAVLYMKKIYGVQKLAEFMKQAKQAEGYETETELEHRRTEVEGQIEQIIKEEAEKKEQEKGQEKEQEKEQENGQEEKQQETDFIDKKEGEDTGKNDQKKPETDVQNIVNPIEVINELRKKGLLSLVAEKPEELSEKEVDTSKLVSNRKRQTGSAEKGNDIMSGVLSDFLFQEYLIEKFPNYRSEKNMGTENLDYQLEYILCGKQGDLDNLKGVVTKLLFLREGSNFLYLMSDQQKQIEAEELAAVLAGSLGILPAQPLIKTALLLAWSFGESILDVRNLLQGGSVPLLKSKQDWKLTLSNLAEVTQAAEKEDGKKEANGLDYTGYIRLLLYLETDEQKTYRCMDMIELTIRQTTGNQSFQMDSCIASIKMESLWRGTPLNIAPFVSKLVQQNMWFPIQGAFGYLEQ